MSTTSPVRSQRPAHGRTPVRLGLTATWLPAAVVVATRVIWAAELPDRVATHWRGSARPDGISSTSGMFAAVLTVTVAAAIVATAAICLRHRVPAVASAGILIGPLVAAPIAASWSISIWATLAAGSAEDATLGPRGLLVVPALVLGSSRSPCCGSARRDPGRRCRPRHSTSRPPSVPPGRRCSVAASSW